MTRLVRPVGLILVALAVGYLVARSLRSGADHGAPDALTRTASAPAFSVHYPRDWTAVDPPGLRGLGLSGEVAIGPGSDSGPRLAVGTIRAPTLDTLPATFLASVSPGPRAETVVLGGVRFDRYLNLRPRGAGDIVSVYLLATTRATIVATCVTARPDPSFTAQCERVLGTLRPARGVEVSAQVDAAYALALNQILATLNVARRADGPGLLADSLGVRARAATRLAAAQARAASDAQRLSAGSAAGPNDTLVSSLRQAASGYRALARAAAHHDRAAYQAAQRTLTDAQTRLTGAFTTLARFGYALR
jgi:hypothetical protein